MQSVGGGFTVQPNVLRIYASGRSGVDQLNGFPEVNGSGNGSTGVAELRRDGFASVSAAAAARLSGAGAGDAVLTTHPIVFTRQTPALAIFLNAEATDMLVVSVLDAATAKPFLGLAEADYLGTRDDGGNDSHSGVRLRVVWRGGTAPLQALVGRAVRLKFNFIAKTSRVYAFWVAGRCGESWGYVAAGGAGYNSSRDLYGVCMTDDSPPPPAKTDDVERDNVADQRLSAESTFIASCSSRTDCSNELQAAIYSGAPTVRVPDIGFPWRVCRVKGRAVDGIWINITNTVIVFEPGVVIEAAPGCFGSLEDPDSLSQLLSTMDHGPHACFPDFLSSNMCAENLTILGYGATLRMQKHEYMNASIYAHNENRGGLYIYRAKNMVVRGLTVTMTGGDGLFLHECASCHFADLVLTDNYRNALSVISARDTTFESCSFVNTGMTGGTAPRLGVGAEPVLPARRVATLPPARAYPA